MAKNHLSSKMAAGLLLMLLLDPAEVASEAVALLKK